MKLLFICTHNRCRSILSEAICRHVSDQGSGLIQAYSAGSQPEGVVHPKSLEFLVENNINVQGLKSESWDAYHAIKFDAVITVCDSAAGEVCPLYLSDAPKVHWGLPDPSKLAAEHQPTAFNQVIRLLLDRLAALDEKLTLAQSNDEIKNINWPQTLHELAKAMPVQQ